ncbi:chromosome-associated kinesin KIF4-like, partial [Ctenocephalides felis]|uniref:chromosome-associated kinesin KIF4-like n=1 Tax=Ctenocephalides felis TaxID=7515 RepID=UPI000E6E5115
MHFHQKFRKLNFMTLLLRVDVVDGLFKGYNVTILAYGQTGSGKTHSMGMAYSVGPVEEMGVIPRAVSFMELYQEQLFDLLSKSNRDQSIVDIREDQQKRIVIPGLTEIEVRNAKDTLDCLVRGYRRRAVGATAMNSQSSRSHAIFTIHIQQRKISDNYKDLMPVIAILLARFKTNVNCIIHLIRIPQYFDFENTSEMEDL